ncbi:MAG: type I restriction enzyme HsdR N-terminal domain-containing protein [Bacteroidota bacterium]
MTKNELIKKGKQADLIRFEKNKIYYVQADQRFPFTPEEEVRIVTYLKLVLHYKYPAQRITFEHLVKMGSSYKRVDVMVFDDNQHTRPFLVCECKRANVGQAGFEEAIQQAKSYDKQLYADYLWVTSGDEERFYKTRHQLNGRQYITLGNIPKFTQKDQLFYRLTEYSATTWLYLKQFYLNYIQPQLRKEWISKWLFFSLIFLVVGFGLSWLHTQTLTPYVVKKTRWLYKISFKELYWLVPIFSTLIVVALLQKQLIPAGMVNGRRKVRQKKQRGLYLFACFLIAAPSFMITSTLFGLEDFCSKCCATQWDCWWSYAHFRRYSGSYQFLEYLLPYSTTVLVQGFVTLLVSWSFRAFNKMVG